MIQLTNIRKSFGEKDVLKGIDAEFLQGQCNLIIGASGTGKSVLLKTMVGLVYPDVGSVLYDNRNYWEASKDEKIEIRREIGMLFQGSALFDSLTVEQNVMFPLDMHTNLSKTEKLDRVNFCLDKVGLNQVNNLMPSEISGGMKKRVGIARAIVMNPKYLFCDEPNSGLDPLTSIKIDNLIYEITKEFEITTVVITHDMNSVIEIGEQIIYLEKGNKIWEGTKDTILNSSSEQLNKFVFSNTLLRKFGKQND